MKNRISILLTAFALVCSLVAPGPIEAQEKNDFPSAGPAEAPLLRASEDTPIDYMGGVPMAIVGALDADDSTYNRVVSCASTSGVGTAVFFDTITITNNSAGQADFVATTTQVGGASCPAAAGIDTLLTAYAPSFNPAAPTTNCVVVNDDINGATDRCSSIMFSIAPGGTAVVVVTSFSNGSQFSYQVNFDGTTPVELLSFSVD